MQTNTRLLMVAMIMAGGLAFASFNRPQPAVVKVPTTQEDAWVAWARHVGDDAQRATEVLVPVAAAFQKLNGDKDIGVLIDETLQRLGPEQAANPQ